MKSTLRRPRKNSINKETEVLPLSAQFFSVVRGYRRNLEMQLREMSPTFSHLGIFFLAFVLVFILFLWKEGKMFPFKRVTPTPTPAVATPQSLDSIPEADVGIQMMIDKANGEMQTSSGSARVQNEQATPSANVRADLDLVGPWVCKAQTKEGPIELYIQNKQIKSTTQTASGAEHTLMSGDCMYEWAGTKGTKQCGMGSYMGLIEMALTSGMMSFSDLVTDTTGETGDQNGLLQALSSCNKGTIASATFNPPQGVTWTENASTDSSSIEDLMQLMDLAN